VRMRNRNPWVLARRRLFGWKVRLPLLTAVALPVLWCASPWARARKNARRWAGDGPSLGGRARAVKTGVSRHCPGDTPLHRWCLLTRGSCGSTPGLLACGARALLEAARQAGTSGTRGERRSPLSTAVDNSVDAQCS
jgi:hypothetical protein